MQVRVKPKEIKARLENLAVVLVETFYPENIGAAAGPYLLFLKISSAHGDIINI